MSWAILVKNVDGAHVDGMWNDKPTAEQIQYHIGGMWEDEQEKKLIDALLSEGYYECDDSACTNYELVNN